MDDLLQDDEDITLNNIARAVLIELQKERSIDIATHKKHHDYIDTLIIEKEKKQERKEQWIRVAGGWGIVLGLSASGAAFLQYIKDHLR